jgi:hypothetical protein
MYTGTNRVNIIGSLRRVLYCVSVISEDSRLQIVTCIITSQLLNCILKCDENQDLCAGGLVEHTGTFFR